jgi:hypothetical protein
VAHGIADLDLSLVIVSAVMLLIPMTPLTWSASLQISGVVGVPVYWMFVWLFTTVSNPKSETLGWVAWIHAWIKQQRRARAVAGGNLAFLRPRPSGAQSRYGIVCARGTIMVGTGLRKGGIHCLRDRCCAPLHMPLLVIESACLPLLP